jgi:hypothetical protein
VWQGTLAFPGTLRLRDTGTVEFSLAGLNYPTDYGRINYSQPLQLTGRLRVIFRGGFLPSRGHQHCVISAPIVGTFQSYSAPPISPSLFITLLYQPDAVQLVTSDATPWIAWSGLDAQGRFTLDVSGIVNQSYAVDASTNLAVWTPLMTNSIPASTVWQFVDEDSLTLRSRFYRVFFLP